MTISTVSASASVSAVVSWSDPWTSNDLFGHLLCQKLRKKVLKNCSGFRLTDWCSTSGAIICISVVSWSDPWTSNDRADGPASPTRPIQSITMGLPDNHCVADITIPQPDPYKISQNYNHGLGILMYQFQQHAVYKITQKFKHHYGTLDNRRTICLSAQSIVHLTAQIQNMETRVANFFWGCTGLYFGPTNTINTKNYQKNTRRPIFRKTTQNALQCTTVHCNVTP